MERAQGIRITWEDLPLRVRDAIEERLGDRVVEAHTQQGGFSPGLAARLRTVSGKHIFLKAAGQELNPLTPGMYRREARIASLLPAHVPAPRFLWSCDEGEDGWIALALADVEGRLPACPWRQAELERVVAAIVEMHEVLTPCLVDVPTAGSRITSTLHGWNRFVGDEEGLDAWSRRHLDRLTDLEAQAVEAAEGDTLLHFDLRGDNILLTEDRVVIVDWPSAAMGAPWIDMLAMAPSVALEGGPEPAVFFAMHPAARVADYRKVDAVLASFAGFFTYQSLQPPPPGLPTLRAFQRDQGEAARRWLAERLDLVW